VLVHNFQPGEELSQFETIIYERHGTVARISLNRPQVLNAYNIQMRDDFSQALAAVADDPDIAALLITGQGRAFCAGADLTEFGTAPSQVVARRVRWQRDVWGQFLGLDQPVVCAVHGYCIGSGLEIALMCDVRIAAWDTVFAMPEVQLGMIPAAGGSQTLPRSIGPSRALDLLLTGRRFDSGEALVLGMITRLVNRQADSGGLLADGMDLAQRLASLPRAAMAAAKRALAQGPDLDLQQGLEMESRLSNQLFALSQP
jgi:enoyl-CoA hydratase